MPSTPNRILEFLWRQIQQPVHDAGRWPWVCEYGDFVMTAMDLAARTWIVSALRYNEGDTQYKSRAMQLPNGKKRFLTCPFGCGHKATWASMRQHIVMREPTGPHQPCPIALANLSVDSRYIGGKYRPPLAPSVLH